MDFSEAARCSNSRPLYYSNNDRPALDPMVLFKMLFLGFPFGIRSERQPVREIQINVAYRCPEYQKDRGDPGASFMAQIPWDTWLAEPKSEMGPETGLSEVLATRSGILGKIHRQLNLKRPNATNPGKTGVRQQSGWSFDHPVLPQCLRF
jgi:hypothetical protein|tara:strand:+ start:3280 stop:3729 length:450 start_codon:yes stop_codon:yes gene_type:complete